MKKLVLVLTALLLAVFCMNALAEDASLQTVLDKGSMIMGFDEAYPPFGFVSESGEYIGFDIELAKEVASRLGIEIVFQPINWDSKELELNNGNIDCIWSGMTMTDELKEALNFSMPYVANEQVLIVRTDSGITSAADCAGKNLGTQAGSSSVAVLDANPDFASTLGSTNLYDDFTAVLLDLKVGGIDVALIDSTVGNYYIAQQDDPQAYTVLPEVLEAEEYGIAFRKADVALADAVNQQLIAIAEDGTLAEITGHWFANDVTVIAKYADQYKK